MNNKIEKNRTLGPFTFSLSSDTEKFKFGMKGKFFILSVSQDITNVDKQLRISIHLYQDIRRTGYSYLIFLQEMKELHRICFAIPIDCELEEQREMIQWIVSKNPGSICYEWYAECYDKGFDASKICGYRIARNKQQKNKLLIYGEIL